MSPIASNIKEKEIGHLDHRCLQMQTSFIKYSCQTKMKPNQDSQYGEQYTRNINNKENVQLYERNAVIKPTMVLPSSQTNLPL